MGCWGLGAPPSQHRYFDDLWKSLGDNIHSFIHCQIGPSIRPFLPSPTLRGATGTRMPAHVPWGAPSPSKPLLCTGASSENPVGAAKGPRGQEVGDGPGVSASGRWVDPVLPEAPPTSTAGGGGLLHDPQSPALSCSPYVALVTGSGTSVF